MGEQSRRLDSWKEIAEYLDRDVRTVMRWAKSPHALPVRRVAGGKGRSVFAFAHEIDEWMAGPAVLDGVATGDAVTAPRSWRRSVAWAVTACGAVAAIASAVVMSGRGSATAPPGVPRAEASESGITLVDASGASRLIHRFDPAELPELVSRAPAQAADIDGDGDLEVVVGIAYYERRRDREVRGGELIALESSGGVRWRFGFDDVLRFGDETYGSPWGLGDWRIEAQSPARIAVSTHHYVWWASMIAVLDHTGRRLGTFVHPGWVESLRWLERDRLALGGFNNARNEAMFAVLNAGDIDGQAPGTTGTSFECLSCPTALPLYYATLPRSELNLLTASRFNRAQVDLVGDRVLATTTEVSDTAAAATGIYEFSADLQLVRARYSEGYWDAHRRLELEGRLAHARETCPERDGPAAIHVWSQAGWERIAAPH